MDVPQPGKLKACVPSKHKPPVSWLNPRTLWESRNDTFAEKLGDPVNDLRRAWVAAALRRGDSSLTIDRTDVDVEDGALRIRCLAATGCLEHEDDPPVEDEVVAQRTGDGAWEWRRDEA